MVHQDGSQSLKFLLGKGEMGVLMRSHDWSATTLGPVENWPLSLKTAVGIDYGYYPIKLKADTLVTLCGMSRLCIASARRSAATMIKIPSVMNKVAIALATQVG